MPGPLVSRLNIEVDAMLRCWPPNPIMTAGWLRALLLALLVPGARAQRMEAVSALLPLPAGITLPVQIHRSLRAGDVRPGTAIVAVTTQRVLVGQHAFLKHGAELHGTVLTSVAGDGTAAKPSTLTIAFTSLRYRKQTVPLVTRAIAMANFTDVDDTFLPTNGGGDRGNPSEASWTTMQVGGDEVIRSGWIGEVCNSTMRTVGYADYYGVYSFPRGAGTTAGSSLPQAVGVFSTTATGLYGFEEGTSLQSSGGAITLTRADRKLVMRNGDDLLLEVLPGSSSAAP